MNPFFSHLISYKKYYIPALFVLVLVMSYFGIRFQPREYAEASTIGKDVENLKDLQDRFKKIANDKGALYAFEILRRAELPPNTDFHLLGHIIGDILYTQKGVGAIANCTQEFRNACSHTIVVGALNEFGGEPALAMIRDACIKAPGGRGAYTMCYHGLGHGVFAFYGYSFPETVKMCEKTGTKEYRNRESVECIGGAVMELSSGGGHNPEAWQKARANYLRDPIGLCTGSFMPDDARAQCLMYITPEIWRTVGINLNVPQPELFDDAFALCDAIPSSQQDLVKACYGGFGKEFVPIALDHDIRKIDLFGARETALVETWCMAAPSRGQSACIQEALQSLFWGGENDPQISVRFCSLLSESNRAACWEGFADAIPRYISTEERSNVCSTVPQEYQVRCSAPPVRTK